MHAELCKYLFNPRSMAVVGASERNPYTRFAVHRLEECGYQGTSYLVNPASQQVFGRQAYERANALPGPIDMAFIAVPRNSVLSVLRDCADNGAKGAVIVSNGFAESHDTLGSSLQNELSEFLRQTPMAVCGPSCLGILNLHEKFQAFGGHPGTQILNGAIALISQSGANVHSFISAALARNLGFSYIVSSGNEVGLELTDYIDYFLDDEKTRVICGYVESIRSPHKFFRSAQRALELRKPIILIKIGRSESSHRAAQAHTGAMTGPDNFYSALFQQTGVIRANSIEEAMDRASVFASSDPNWWPRGNRMGLVSVSGGFAVTLSDMSSEFGYEVPELAPQSSQALADILPLNVNPQNPVDISTQVQRDRPKAWEQTIQCITADYRIDFVLNGEALPVSRERVLTLLREREQSGKAVLLATTSPHIDVFDHDIRALCLEHGIPLLAGVDGVQRALQSAIGYSYSTQKLKFKTAKSVKKIPRPALNVLHEVDARALLERFAIKGPIGRLVNTSEEAVHAAKHMGGTIALKVVSADIPHRSDRGLVMLKLSPAQIPEAFQKLQQRLTADHIDPAACRFLVQAMVQGVAELIVGVTCQPGYPPLLVIGFGGIFVELLKDVSTRVCPVDVEQAHQMLRELRMFASIDGYRGQMRADIDAAACAIASMSDFAMGASDWLEEAEINPLILLPQGYGAQAADAVIIARKSL